MMLSAGYAKSEPKSVAYLLQDARIGNTIG